jgi:hypothetical protein
MMTQVDFSYAFATPHRLTVALPDSSHKTLIDMTAESLRMSWSYDNLLDKPLAAFIAPKTEWEVLLKPEVDGRPFAHSRWTRAEGWLPVLENTYNDEQTLLRLEATGASSAAIIRVEVMNQDQEPHRILLRCEKPGAWNGYNPAWVQPDWDPDVLLAGWAEQADRVVILVEGGDEKPVLNSNTVCLAWNLAPGQKRVGWVIRPYRAYQPQLPALRETDWDREIEAAREAWRRLIGRAGRVTIPDAAVQHAFYAGLADCFVMREPVADGSIAGCPGTEMYRASSCFEPLIVSVLFDQVGLHEAAAGNIMMCVSQQGPDGNWADPLGWAHLMWGASGMKAWSIMEHYRLTGDKPFLVAVYPHMLASSRWQARQRTRTRVLSAGEKPLTYGLMPRGMGDGGLMGEDGSYYGVFLPHNILSVYADAMTVAAAEILGQTGDLPELRQIYQEALADLLQALERGAIQEEDYRWMPGVPGETVGSRWGTLYAAFPCRLLPPDHALITGTIRKFEARLSTGGIPVHTGWMKDGMWVAITLDNLAEVLLLRNEGDKAVQYLYATLNHGTPLYSWCEERGQEPGSKDCTGDRQHLWTPLAVGRFIRDALVMENGDTLHLARGVDRQWLASGEPLGVRGMPTFFGRLSYELRYDPTAGRVTGFVELEQTSAPRVALHLRLPGGLQIKSLSAPAGVSLSADATVIEWQNSSQVVRFEAVVG